MFNKIGHVSLTVKDLDKSIKFYEDILGMKVKSKKMMDCKSTEVLFGINACKVRVAYLIACRHCDAPDIKLLQFSEQDTLNDQIIVNRVSISSVTFYVDDIDKTYKEYKEKGVEFVSEPQYFDSTEAGLGKIKSAYFKDPNGIILELQQVVEEGLTAKELGIDINIGPSDDSVSRV